MWGKTAPWGETLQISDTGQISINGETFNAVGFHLPHGTVTPSLTIAEGILSYLQNKGIRLISLSIAHWCTENDWLRIMNFWFPLLIKYQMWVYMQVQHQGSPPVLTSEAQLPRIDSVLNLLNQNPDWCNIIFAWSLGWELDLTTFQFTEQQITSYLETMFPLVKSRVINSLVGNVPILNKPVYAENIYAQTRPLYVYCDLVGPDRYPQVENGDIWAYYEYEISTLHNYWLPLGGKSGFYAWHSEFGIWGGNDAINQTVLDTAIANYGFPLGVIMIWISWNSNANNLAAFNVDGSPKAWIENITFPYAPPPPEPPPPPDCVLNEDCQTKYGEPEPGYMWVCESGVCVQVKTVTPSLAARTVGPFGVPSSMLHQLWKLRQKYIRPEVHKKLHPVI